MEYDRALETIARDEMVVTDEYWRAEERLDAYYPAPTGARCGTPGCGLEANANEWVEPNRCCNACPKRGTHDHECTLYADVMSGLSRNIMTRPYVRWDDVEGKWKCLICNVSCKLKHFQQAYHLDRERGISSKSP